MKNQMNTQHMVKNIMAIVLWTERDLSSGQNVQPVCVKAQPA